MITPPIAPGRCIETVYDPGIWHRGHQCSRKRVKGPYCTQHHPDSVKKRQDAQAARYREKEAKSPWRKLEEAVKREKKLQGLLRHIARAARSHDIPRAKLVTIRDLTKEWL